MAGSILSVSTHSIAERTWAETSISSSASIAVSRGGTGSPAWRSTRRERKASRSSTIPRSTTCAAASLSLTGCMAPPGTFLERAKAKALAGREERQRDQPSTGRTRRQFFTDLWKKVLPGVTQLTLEALHYLRKLLTKSPCREDRRRRSASR